MPGKKAVKNFMKKFLPYRIPPRGMKVLKRLGEGLSQTETARRLGISKQSVNYWARKFLRDGLIREKVKDAIKIYELTSLGQKVLTWGEGGVVEGGFTCVLEDYAVKFRVLSDRGCLDWVKVGEPRNWVKLGLRFCDGVWVERTSRHVIVHSGRVLGFSPLGLLVEAGRVIEFVCAWLRDHGLELDPFGVPVHEPVFRFYTREANLLGRFGTFITEKGSVDRSPPERVPHVEFKGLSTALNYIEMPDRLERVEKKLDILTEKFDRLAGSLERVSKPLEKLASFFEANSVDLRKGKVDRYIG